jgi:NarL family two-component system response regulator YdfI
VSTSEADVRGVLRVAVVAASAVERAGLEAVLARSGLDVVASISADASTLRPSANDPSSDLFRHADVVVLSLAAREPRDAERAAAWVDAAAPAPVILLADAPSRVAMRALLGAGVRALLSHDAAAEEIIAAVHAAAAGLAVMTSDALASLAGPAPSLARSATAAPETPLSPREVQVLSMLAEGFANKRIAERLGISEHTVKTHIASLFEKLHASTRTEAVTTGARLGLILL